MINEGLFEKIKEKIVKAVSPKKIILIGSHVKETATLGCWFDITNCKTVV